MQSPIDLRIIASALDAIRVQLSGDSVHQPDPSDDPDPELAAAAALSALESVMEDGLNCVARMCAEAAEAMRVVASAYEAIEERRQSGPAIRP